MAKQTYTIIAALLGFTVGWLLISVVYTPEPVSNSSWQVYENSRFGYELGVPASFITQEASQNNDGRVFVSPSGSTTVRVYGRNNSDDASVSGLVGDQTQQLDSLRDAQVGSSSAVLYGTNESGQQQTIKLLHNPNTVAFVEVTNPQLSLTKEAQMKLLNSFRWNESQANGWQPQATTTDDRSISFVPQAAEDLIRVEQPTSEATISSPLEITGEARGQWFFEADAPVVLTDWDGRIIAEGYIQAEGEWMTEEFVPFSGTLEFETPEDVGRQSVRGSLIIQRANPSGQSENDMAVEIPVRFNR